MYIHIYIYITQRRTYALIALKKLALSHKYGDFSLNTFYMKEHFREEILLRVVTLSPRYVVVNKGEKNQDIKKSL